MGASDSLTPASEEELLRRKIVAPVTVSADDFIDEDDLLTEEDKQKPDPASLRGYFVCQFFVLSNWIKLTLNYINPYFIFQVCGTTGKRKACKDCSCGLAEELANEARPAGPPAGKSSCGSVRNLDYSFFKFSFALVIHKVKLEYCIEIIVVLSWRCLQMRHMPVPWYASLQTRWESCVVRWFPTSWPVEKIWNCKCVQNATYAYYA